MLAFLLAAAFAPPLAAAGEPPCAYAFSVYGDPLADVTCRCGKGNSGGAIWGTMTYAGLSNVCAAAQHAGALAAGGEGSVRLLGTEACPAYLNSILNGIESQYFGAYENAFHFPAVSDGTCPPAIRLTSSKGFYQSGEAVSVRYFGLPDDESHSASYRIAVVLRGTPDDDLGDRWDYTFGHQGNLEVGILPDGLYEARLLSDPAAFVLRRHDFVVGGLKIGAGGGESQEGDAPPGTYAKAEAERQVYDQGEIVTVRYGGLPGNTEDLIAVVPQGTPDDHLGDNWHSFTYGSSAGWFAVFDLPSGHYEVRSYFDGALNEVRTRSTFAVK